MALSRSFLTGALALGLGLTGVNAQTAPRAGMVSVFQGSGSFLGVGIQEIDSERAKELKLGEEAGVEVTHVDENSPADKAGLKAGDVVVQFNNQRVEGMEQLSRMVRETPAGRDVKLGFIRNGVSQTAIAKIASRPQPSLSSLPRVSEMMMPDIPQPVMGWRSSLLGVAAESLDGQLAEYFGVKDGVLVRSVIAGSAAEKAGIKAGDVITRVDDGGVATPSDISSRVRALRGKTVPVILMRDHKEVRVSVTMGGDDRNGRAQRPQIVDSFPPELP